MERAPRGAVGARHDGLPHQFSPLLPVVCHGLSPSEGLLDTETSRGVALATDEVPKIQDASDSFYEVSQCYVLQCVHETCSWRE